MSQRSIWSATKLWPIYLILLVVLFPDTVWAYGRFESQAMSV
jgi:hypothetical protein